MVGPPSCTHPSVWPTRALKPPTMTASDAKDATTTPRRTRVLRTRNSSPPGDDGAASIPTRPGDVQLLPVNPPDPSAPKSALLLRLYVLLLAAAGDRHRGRFGHVRLRISRRSGSVRQASDFLRRPRSEQGFVSRVTSTSRSRSCPSSLLPWYTGHSRPRWSVPWRCSATSAPISALGPLHVRRCCQRSPRRDSRWTCGCDGK